MIDGKELARLMRAGIKIRPRQAFMSSVRLDGAGCALQALLEGLAQRKLESEMPAMENAAMHAAFTRLGSYESCLCPACTVRRNVSNMLVHLNDSHRWSRERIAAWLEAEFPGEPEPMPEPPVVEELEEVTA